MSEFVTIDVEPGPGSQEGISLRFKRVATGDTREVDEIRYESESGLDGCWRVLAVDDAHATQTKPAQAFLVEDSSDGSAWLVAGGAHGLLLTHEESGVKVREAYLLLSSAAF